MKNRQNKKRDCRLDSTAFQTSIVCGLLHKVGHEKRFEKMIDGKHGIKLRKLAFYDVEIPLDDKRYNKAVNLLKPFLCGILDKGFSILPFKKFIEKKLNKHGLRILRVSGKFKTQPRHPLNYCGFAPLLLDEKYLNFKFMGQDVYTPEQKANLIRLRTFETKGYKPIINGKPTDENLLIKDEDLI